MCFGVALPRRDCADNFRVARERPLLHYAHISTSSDLADALGNHFTDEEASKTFKYFFSTAILSSTSTLNFNLESIQNKQLQCFDIAILGNFDPVT